jgi:hypothetical protein
MQGLRPAIAERDGRCVVYWIDRERRSLRGVCGYIVSVDHEGSDAQYQNQPHAPDTRLSIPFPCFVVP